MRLIESSVPRAVGEDEARRRLDQRWLLADTVWRAVENAEAPTDRRPREALDLLREWVSKRYEGSIETHPADGLHLMTVPRGYEATMEELRASTQVAESLAMLWTTDTQGEYRSDTEQVLADLGVWREVCRGSEGSS